MKKYTLCFVFSALMVSSCQQRKEFCECADIQKMMTNALTKSKQELEAEYKGCEWIEEELSIAEIAAKTVECYTKDWFIPMHMHWKENIEMTEVLISETFSINTEVVQ